MRKRIVLPLLAALCLVFGSGGGVFAAEKERSLVKLETTKGDIVIELFPDKAPKTVENFLEYVKSGAYDGTIFHRVINGFMIQGGGFDQDLRARKGRAPIRNEADNGLKNERYTVAMARTNDPHSASNQFFINVANNDFLDHRSQSQQGWGYTVFGKVVDGERVVDGIKNVPVADRGPFEKVPHDPVIIKKAYVFTLR